jgi:C4-dicarboxylate-specific signal transduction histidine kinase/ActR/RegA family two-component response regulator
MKTRWPTRLSWRLLLAILPAVVLGVTGIVWFQYRMARREILIAAREELRLVTSRTADNLDDLLDQRRRDLMTLAETPQIADYYRNEEFGLSDEAETYRRELERYLGRFARRGRGYARILYLDRSGREVVSIADGRPALRRGRDAGADFFRRALAAPPGGWWSSPIETLPGTGPVVYYSAPVRDELGRIRGVLALAYDLAQARDLLKAASIGRRGRAFLRTDLGVTLGDAPPGRAKGLMTETAGLSRRSWSLLVEVPREDFLGPLRTVRDAAVAGGLLGLALLALSLLMVVRSITRPLAALAEAARRVGRGDFGHRVAAPASGELGDLARAFNEMAARLQAEREVQSTLQAQLVQAEKLSAVGQLISAVAHELNNPLAAISGYAQLALGDACPPALRDDLKRVYDNVLRCRKVVDNLLFFVRKSRRERRRVDLSRAVDAALELLEYRLLKTEGVAVVREAAGDAPPVLGDFQQVVQVLVNLIGNACDAMESAPRLREGKRLILRVGAADEGAFLEVEDNGLGVPADARDRLFEPFFSTKEPGRGTGLGLSICRQIVSEHGGTLTFRPAPVRGAVFRAELPAGREDDFERVEAPDEPRSLPAVPGRRVLVADDEPDVAEMMARLLREDGDEAVVETRGADAVRRLERERFDLVVSDMGLEDLRGEDVHEAASRAAGGAPAELFVTGDVLNPRVLEFLSRTGADYLVKPFDVEDFRRAVRRLLGAARARG